ncbi:hypothetical protein ABIB25_003720 [Nakamurella sp. UYEF19]|uniref:hypothetical protein n=1 Tax=Nakamurella sp. UYEF19 TaxID=1756392 RepID=UPI003397B5C3
MTIGMHLAPSLRRRTAAALAAVTVVVAGLVIALDQTALAGPGVVLAVPAAAAAPVTTTVGKISLSVEPASGLTAAGGTINVVGNGFKMDGGAGLWVVICHADGKAPANLADCVGGAIPNSNTSTSWGHITTAGTTPAGGGPVGAKWFSGGAFSVNLTLPASNPASDALDCSKVPCAVYTKADSGSDTSQSLSVPLVYAAAAGSGSGSPTSTPASTAPVSSTSSSSTPTPTPTSQSTSIIAAVPTTVSPKTIKASTVVAGGNQEVLFAGFTKGEFVSVTLYSAPRSLPAAKADSDGVVRIAFIVPADLPVGTHLLRIVGAKSKVTGVASFQVIAPPVSSAPISSAPPSSTPVASSAAVSSAPVSSAVVPPVTVASPSPSVVSSAPVTSAAAPVPGSASSGSRLVWPWYVLGVIVLLWIGFAVWMLQRRRHRLDADMREKERILAEGAAAEHQRATDALGAANSDAPTAYLGDRPTEQLGGYSGQTGGYTGYHPGEHGLLSGRDNPDNPGLLSGNTYRPDDTADQPTTYLPPSGTPGRPGSFGTGDVPDARNEAGPPTGAWRPDFTEQPPTEIAGPQTGAWRPDFTDQPSVDPGREADADPGREADADPGREADADPDGDEPSPGGRHSR